MRCFWMQLFMRQKNEAEQTEEQIQQHSNAFQTSTSNEQPPVNFQESSGCRFKTLAEQDLQEIVNAISKTLNGVLVFLTVSISQE